MYHRIASARCQVAENAEIPYAVGVEEFAWQLEYLRSSDRRGVSMARIHATLMAGDPVPDNWVGITFDDGNGSDVVHALPMLCDAGFDATFYVGTGRLGEPEGLDEEMVRQLNDDGMHVGSHGVTHRFLNGLSRDEEVAELLDSRDRLESIVGSTVDHFAPPGGRYSRRTLHALDRLGYVAVATSAFGFNRSRGDRQVYKRIPVMAATDRGHFTKIVSRNSRALLPAYLRSRTLYFLRRAVGESAYSRVRAAAGRS